MSNPFETLSPIPLDGRGLNPLLEDANMMTHPPLLYTGFVGLTVPFAFAMAALIVGKVDEAWITTTRRWTIIAWFFLTAGNLVGAWWSYHVLGWGGYWAWDPVENAAFMPWLPATAFLHSVQVQERRRMLKVWNLSLIIVAFSLTIFGTFLTRSGIISSIHAFSSGPVGAFFLGFLAFILLGSFGLLAYRGDLLKEQPELDSMVSRESAFLLNNIVLVSALFTIFLGTIFPLISEAVAGVQVSVGAPYFNSVTVPLFLCLVFLMAVGPMIAWRRASWDNLKRNFLWPASAALLFGFGLFLWKVQEFLPLLGFTLLAFVVCTMSYDTALALRARRRIAGEGLLRGLITLTRRNQRRYGGFIVHLGVVLIIMGIAGSMTYSKEKEATLAVKQNLTVGNYRIQFEGLKGAQQPTHFRVEGAFRVFHNGKDEWRHLSGAKIFSEPAVADRPRRAPKQLERRYLSDSFRLQRSRAQPSDAQSFSSPAGYLDVDRRLRHRVRHAHLHSAHRQSQPTGRLAVLSEICPPEYGICNLESGIGAAERSEDR